MNKIKLYLKSLLFTKYELRTLVEDQGKLIEALEAENKALLNDLRELREK